MGIREKIIGVLLIVVGAWPFLIMIEQVNKSVSELGILNILTPGKIIYQLIVILLGLLLLIRLKPKVRVEARR